MKKEVLFHIEMFLLLPCLNYSRALTSNQDISFHHFCFLEQIFIAFNITMRFVPAFSEVFYAHSTIIEANFWLCIQVLLCMGLQTVKFLLLLKKIHKILPPFLCSISEMCLSIFSGTVLYLSLLVLHNIKQEGNRHVHTLSA